MNVVIAQTPIANGVLVTVSLSSAAPIIVYAQDKESKKVYDLKEVLDAQTVHNVPLKVPVHFGDMAIVARPILLDD